MNCRFIERMICREANEEILTLQYCQCCLSAHISNQVDKLIKMLDSIICPTCLKEKQERRLVKHIYGVTEK